MWSLKAHFFWGIFPPRCCLSESHCVFAISKTSNEWSVLKSSWTDRQKLNKRNRPCGQETLRVCGKNRQSFLLSELLNFSLQAFEVIFFLQERLQKWRTILRRPKSSFSMICREIKKSGVTAETGGQGVEDSSTEHLQGHRELWCLSCTHRLYWRSKRTSCLRNVSVTCWVD